MANAPKTTTAKAEKGNSSSNVFASLAIIICFVIGALVYFYIMGDPKNFIDDNPDNQPKPGNYYGMVYKAGAVIPILLALFLMVFVFSIERFIVIGRASGKGNVGNFVRKVQGLIGVGNLDSAVAECDKQQGSVANVIKSGLLKYKDVSANPNLDTEQSVLAIQKEIEEATALEMPMLEKNLTVIATLVSIGTLVGLLGTVTGMIKAFSALSTAGAPDSSALATGISEALMCTASGIGTSTLAIVLYNLFTTKIDKLTHFIDESGFAITQSYRRHNN